MQTHVTSEKKRVTFRVLFGEETLNVLLPWMFVKILTRKIEKDLQLIWPLKYDTVFRT